MARSTLERDYDVNRMLQELQREVAELKRRVKRAEGFAGGFASAGVSALQSVVSATPAPLTTPVVATLDLLPGSYRVFASVSGLFGSTASFNPASSGHLMYRLTGALSFLPTSNSAGVGGDNAPSSNAGGTFCQVHNVDVEVSDSLTIEAVAVRNEGSVSLLVRDIQVQLVVLSRRII